jgi:hypothetical protein
MGVAQVGYRSDQRPKFGCIWVAVCEQGHIQARIVSGIELLFALLFTLLSARTSWAPARCRTCSARVLVGCDVCSAKIAATKRDWQPDRYCARCGTAYPWTRAETSAPSNRAGGQLHGRAAEGMKRLGRGIWRFLSPILEELGKALVRAHLGRKLGLPG